jgi:exonuclease VII large subunit
VTNGLQVLAVFDYLQNQLVASRIESIVKEVTEIMKNFKQLTGQDLKNGNGQIVSMDKKFSEYMRKQFKDTEEWGRKWLGDAITLHTEKQFQAKIRELKTLAIDLSHKETDKVKTRRAAYLQTVKDKREILEKAMEPLKTQLKQLKTDLETEKKKIVAIEADVYREPLTSKKQLIRSAGKWKDLVAGFENTEKEIVKQQEKVNQQQRRIDLLYGGRVGQIWRNLEADLRVFRDRRSKLDTWIKMPALP